MTQARTTAPGLGNPPLIQLLLEAVACAFVCLVETVRATFGMRFNRRDHDWHMTPAHDALPQTKPDTHQKASHHQQRSFSGKRSASRESWLETPWGQTDIPLETRNRDSRHKAENDTVEAATIVANRDDLEACLLARIPGAGRDPASAQRALLTRTTVIPAEARKRVRNDAVCASENSLT